MAAPRPGGVGHGAVERAHHHGEVEWVAGVEEDVVAAEHHGHVEQHDAHGKEVERDAALAEALEEARPHLEAYHEDEEDEAEILQEREDVRRAGEPHVAGEDAGEEHERDTERDAP